jgi:isopentenyl phosphate kinase
MILLKLGGSVLTDKSRYKVARGDAIRRLCAECVAARDPLLLVHGAGSFGHIVAREFKLRHGAASPDAWRAASQVHADVRELDAMVLAALREAGAAAFSVGPWGFARLRDGALVHIDLSPLLLAPASSVPVTFGDIVADETRGVGIVSGDELMVRAGAALREAGEPVDAVFALAADGVLDEEGKLIPTLARDARVPTFAKSSASTKGAAVDVTGGLAAKVAAARSLAASGARVRFVNGLVPGRLAQALAGERVAQTEVF